MRFLLLLALMGSTACLVDRTGQSAVSDWKRQLALQEAQLGDFERRLVLLETSLRARGRQEVENMEDLDGVRSEIRRLRGELEIAQNQVQALDEVAGVLQDESDIRLQSLEERLGQVEQLLGKDLPSTAVSLVDEEPADDVSPLSTPPESPSLEGPDGLLELAQEHLAGGRAVAARAVLVRYADENPQSPKVLEAQYLVGETWYAEGSFQQAVLAYEEVVQGDSDSIWAPRAILRQGECFQAMGRADEARLFWEDLVSKYPRSEEAARARSRLDAR